MERVDVQQVDGERAKRLGDDADDAGPNAKSAHPRGLNKLRACSASDGSQIPLLDRPPLGVARKALHFKLEAVVGADNGPRLRMPCPCRRVAECP
jgi:hypothetical protein